MKPFTIEKNIPIPKRKPPVRPRWPLAQMKPGDSFLVPGGKVRSVSSAVSTRARLMNGEGHRYHFSVRTVSGGVRVWRTK